MKYLEYIQSQGTCKIDTGNSSLSISKILLKVNIQSGYTDYGAFFANSGNTSNGTRYFALFTRSNGFQFRTGNDQGTPFPFTVDTDYIIECNRVSSIFTVDGVAGTTSGLGTINDNSIYLFWDPAWNSTSRHVYFKLYYCKMYDNNDNLVRDFVPAEDDNGIGCLFDKVTGYFFYTPTDTFIKGPEVEPPLPPTGEFPVYIQRNNSESIHLDKDLTDILTTYAWLKESTSIINPTFVLEASLADLVRANYVTVPTFGRSYFIQDIISITTDLVELNCHVDVLSSFKDDIRANKGITHRQEENWNLYLNDGVLQVYQNPIVTTQKFPNGFTENNFVLVLAGSRNAGVFVGEGGAVQVEPTVTFTDGGGAGNTTSKTTSGLVQWGYRHYNDGAAYWFGTFGQTADTDLLQERRSVYSSYYPDPGNPPFVDQFGKRVFDCVGLIKGYRWYKFPSIHYEASQDVDVKGLWNQCIKNRGYLQSGEWNPIPYVGAVLFTENLDHCGILVERNLVIEARGHLYGVVASRLEDRYFTRWGVPDWMQIDTPRLTE